MRHQSITLTMDTYGHLVPGACAEAVGSMGQMLVEPRRALQATGTDDEAIATNISERAQRLAQHSGRETLPFDAAGCDEEKVASAQEETPKPLQVADLGVDVPDVATPCESAPRRTRTFNPLIKSQMLCQLS